MSSNALQDRMIKLHGDQRVCRRQTDIVIEGYPRSGNTFAVRMLQLLDPSGSSDPDELSMDIAHHTHDIGNLRLAVHMQKPMVVLTRDPAEAILSYLIYSNRALDDLCDRYIAFHANVLALPRRPAVIDFATVVSDFNVVVDRINAILPDPDKRFRRSDDLAADTARAHEISRQKSAMKRGSKDAAWVGVPTPARETLKNNLRAKVLEHLDKTPDIRNIYHQLHHRDP